MRQFNNRSAFGKQGQTLMEILVGLGVVAAVFSGVAGLVYLSLNTARVSREKSAAQSLVNDMSAAVKSIVNYDWHKLWSSAGGVLYLPLDEGVGSGSNNSQVLDEVGGANGIISLGSTGNLSLADAWLPETSCQAGQCLSFDGADDYISIADTSATTSPLDLASWTFSAWVYPTDLASYDPIFAKVNSVSGYGYEFANSSGAVRAINRAADGTCDYAAGSLSLNTWQQVAAVYDAASTSLTLYLNGQQVGAPQTCISNPGANNNNLLVGARATDSSKFSGRLDEIRIYGRALAPTEVNNLYTGINEFYPVHSAGLWELKEGRATSTDATATYTRSFHLERVLRDSSNNIVSSGGNPDPATKKVVYRVDWPGQSLEQEEYISRSVQSGVFIQTDWSGGAGETDPVFSATTKFDSASSTVSFSTAGQLTAGFSSNPGGATMNSTYHWAWNDIVGWIDFANVNYDSFSGALYGTASSSIGTLALNCGDTSCASSNFAVQHATATGAIYTLGDLFGYAWSEGTGWVSANCDQRGVGGSNDCASSNYKGSITQANGDFNGFWWNDGIGWISLNCNDLSICATSDYKVKFDNFSSTGTSTEGAWLISSIFDTQREQGVTPAAFIWQGTLPTGTAVRFQLATANSPLGPWNFVGSDGTSNSYYPNVGSAQPNSGTSITSKYHSNQRYLRYKVFLITNASASPTVEDISILYAQ